MVSGWQSPQHISRLAPLADVVSWIDANVRAVAPRDCNLDHATGGTLAAPAIAPAAVPHKTIALRDGYVVQSEWTSDAGAYAPIPLPHVPPEIVAGEELPPGADCIAAHERIAIDRGIARAIAPVAPGDGILPAGGDAMAQRAILAAGEKLTGRAAAVLHVAKVASVGIRRPRIAIALAQDAGSEIMAAAAKMVNDAVTAQGGTVVPAPSLAAAFRESECDAVFAIGGTGTGRNDTSVVELKRAGTLAFHGIGLMPGDTAALGAVGGKPVLLMPGRIDAALACWLAAGQKIFGRLANARDAGATAPVALSRKITSTIGIADVVLLRRHGEKAEPLAAGYWPLQALAQADSYLVVPPESEGYPEGTIVNAGTLS